LNFIPIANLGEVQIERLAFEREFCFFGFENLGKRKNTKDGIEKACNFSFQTLLIKREWIAETMGQTECDAVFDAMLLALTVTS